MDKIVRELIPECLDATLVEIRVQVVAGLMYHLIYKQRSVQHRLKVWIQPWNNNLIEIQRENGEKVRRGG